MGDLVELGNEIALQIMLTKRVREPTLWEIQKDLGKRKTEEFVSPAWLLNSQPHPGLPEHYVAKWSIENKNELAADKEDAFPLLPFDVHREILRKLLIVPFSPRKSKMPPTLNELQNGTIIVVGTPLLANLSIEIFLSFNGKLFPCCYCRASEIITRSPINGQVRCYYIPSLFGSKEISFVASNEQPFETKIGYQTKWFHGSTPYDVLRGGINH